MTSPPVRVVLHRIRLPLRAPHRAATAHESVRDLVLVEVERADGVVGWGECSALSRPTYTAEHTAGAWLVLRDELAPALLDGRPSPVVGHPMAHAAVRGAMLDAELRGAGRSLADHLAAAVGATVLSGVARTAVVASDAEPGAVVALVAARLAEGCAAVKLKASPDPMRLAAAEAVRRAWPDLSLAVDWNGTADEEALRRIDGLGVRYHEQPAPAGALATSAGWAHQLAAPVALDESIVDVPSLEAAAFTGAGSLVNLKPARCGGLDEAAALVRRAAELGLGWFVGGMLESGVGRAGALALAALDHPALAAPTDLGPSAQYVDVDVTDPVTIDADGWLVVPRGPGLGVEVDRAAVAAATTDRFELAR